MDKPLVVVLFDLSLEVFSLTEGSGRGYISFILVVEPPRVVAAAVWLLMVGGRLLAGDVMALAVAWESTNVGRAILDILGVDGVELQPDPLLLLNIVGGAD
jgi:hypothetical protein